MRAPSPTTYTLTDLAREFNITKRTIRLYEEYGLLFPDRLGRKRIYSPRERSRLSSILHLKRLGFSLREIREQACDQKDEGVGLNYFTPEQISRQVARLEQKRRALEEALSELGSYREHLLQFHGQDEGG